VPVRGAVGDLDGDVVDIIGAGVGRVLVVRAETNDSAPVEASMVKSEASAPPTIE